MLQNRERTQVINKLRPERVTQNRVVKRITTPVADGGLGYVYLGNWSKDKDNRCIESDLLRASLKRRGYSDAPISQAVERLLAASDVTGITLYQANLRTYQLLRYGVPVQICHIQAGLDSPAQNGEAAIIGQAISASTQS